MKKLLKFKKDFQYFFELSFSVLKYWVSSVFQIIADYFVYLEIARFRLWNSIQANTGLDPSDKSDKIKGVRISKNTLVLRPVYTKIIDWFETFPPVRGFAWDIGLGVQASEAELIRYEHSLGLDKYYVYGRVERYLKINYPKVYVRHFFFSQKSEDYKNINYFSRFIEHVNSSIYVIYSITFCIFFFIFLFFDTLYLFFYWLLLYILIKLKSINHNRSGSTFSVFLYFINIYKFLVTSILVPLKKFILLIIRPIFYFFYLSLVFFFCILYFLKSLYLIFYLCAGGTFFRIFFFFKKIYLYLKIKDSALFGIRLFNLIFWKSIYYPAFVFIKAYRFWLIFSEYLRFYHGFLNAIRLYIGIFVEFITRVIVVLIIFKLFWKDIFWFSNYVIGEVIGMEYTSLIGPGAVSVLVISTLAFIIPELYSLMKFTENARRSTYELGYDDEAEISDLTVHFFRALSKKRGASKILKKWPLANEIIPLQMMNEAETSGKFRKNFEKVVHYLKPDISTRKSRLNFLVDHLVNLDPSSRSNSVVDRDAKLETNARAEDRIFFDQARMENSQKFKPKEFSFVQSDLLRLYQVFIDSDASLVTRAIYAYQSQYYDRRFKGSHFGFIAAYQPEIYIPKPEYPSSFISPLLFSQIIFLRSSEFSKVFKSSIFFFRSSAEFPTRGSFSFFDKLDWADGEYLNKLGEVRSSWNWDNNLISATRNWVRSVSSKNIQQFRGLSNSRDLFWFRPVLGDTRFQEFLFTSAKYLHRNFYLGFSIYMQILYDFYWVLRLNTNAFLAYTFNPEFLFSSAINLPNWLFQNSLFNVPASYPVLQDGFGSLINYLSDLEPISENISNALGTPSQLVNDLSKSDNLDNELEILYNFKTNLEFYTSYINPLNPDTFSIDYVKWRKDLGLETRVRDRQRIDDVIENYIVDQTGIIDLKIFSLMNITDRNYQAQSAFMTYLHERTSITLSRYVLREREKVGGISADIMGIIRALTVGSIEEDKLLREFQQDSEFMESIDQYDEETHRQLLDARVAVLSFPAITPSIIVHLYLMFVNASYVHLFMSEEVSYKMSEYTEQSELVAALIDFGLWLAGALRVIYKVPQTM